MPNVGLGRTTSASIKDIRNLRLFLHDIGCAQPQSTSVARPHQIVEPSPVVVPLAASASRALVIARVLNHGSRSYSRNYQATVASSRLRLTAPISAPPKNFRDEGDGPGKFGVRGPAFRFHPSIDNANG